jgi:hypothetical protein
VDPLLRACHHFESNGAPLEAKDHPGWRTWSGTTHLRTAGDKLGKAGNDYPWGYGMGTQRRAGFDDQHWTGSYTAATRAVTDDALLEASAWEELQTDSARAFHKDNRTGAPRSGGRLLKKWAMYWHVTFEERQKELIHTLCTDELNAWERNIDSHGTGPVRPSALQGPDPRVLRDHTSWIPWQEALLCCGLIHQYYLWRDRDQELADKAGTMAVGLGENHILYGTVRDVMGKLQPLTGVKWLEGGLANDEAYYTYPREGAGPGGVVDLLVGSGGWFSGMGAPACMQFTREHTTNASAGAMLDEVLALIDAPQSTGAAEWMY